MTNLPPGTSTRIQNASMKIKMSTWSSAQFNSTLNITDKINLWMLPQMMRRVELDMYQYQKRWFEMRVL